MLTWYDILIIVAFLVSLFGVSAWVARRGASREQFFLAGCQIFGYLDNNPEIEVALSLGISKPGHAFVFHLKNFSGLSSAGNVKHLFVLDTAQVGMLVQGLGNRGSFWQRAFCQRRRIAWYDRLSKCSGGVYPYALRVLGRCRYLPAS